jgi:hypothetical protein
MWTSHNLTLGIYWANVKVPRGLVWATMWHPSIGHRCLAKVYSSIGFEPVTYGLGWRSFGRDGLASPPTLVLDI